MGWTFTDQYGRRKTLAVQPAMPQAEVTISANQGIAAAGWRTVAWDTETFKSPASIHSNSVNNSRLIAPQDGIYLVDVSCSWAAGQGAGEAAIQFSKNGGAKTFGMIDLNETNTYGLATAAAIKLVAGDYIEVQLWSQPGCTIRPSGTRFTMTWIATAA